MMIRSLTISLFLWLALAPLCHTQSPTEADAADYQFSTGIAAGRSFSLRSMSVEPGDPLYLPDNVPHTAVAIICTYHIVPAIALELVMDGIIAPAGLEFSSSHRELAGTLYPGYHVLSTELNEFSLVTFGLGISYRIRLGRFAVEPSVLLCLGRVYPMWSHILLKADGENSYRTVHHETELKEGLLPAPALTLRYLFEESRWGIQLRGAYYRRGFDILHTTSEETLAGPEPPVRFMAHHVFEAVHVGLGVSYGLF